jgi:UDP-N-acetylglucosamine--N-acetylmuramyl-(pentapeptide) pyrophosphoryl-undecaprenol N-acetylglucosamine transferase
VIAAGGTAGHVVPALAVAGALQAEGAEVTFVGGERAEAELVPAAGFQLRKISVEGMSRSNPLRALRALARAGGAFLHARSLLKELAPDAVLGGGGYVAGPVGLAAVTLRIPLVLSEADSHFGLTNRLLAPAARRVCLAFPRSGLDSDASAGKTGLRRLGRRSRANARNGARYRVTGRPIPPAQMDRQGARERLGIASGDTCVLVFGGSLGARSINLAAVAGEASTDTTSTDTTPIDTTSTPRTSIDTTPIRVPSTGKVVTGTAFGVLHVAGRRDYPELAARNLPPGYDLREYLDLEAFADALAAADLVVARAGGSVFEIAASGTPAILVPYPHASADHQTANARWMADAGAAIVIPDRELNGTRLAREVAALLADRARLAAMARSSKELARPHAAGDIADELLKAAVA